MRRLAWPLAATGVLATLAACGSSGHAYSGHMYSVAQVETAFAQLGLKPRGAPLQQHGLATLQMRRYLSGLPAGRAGIVVVATRRSTVGSAPPLPGRLTRYANVTAFTRPHVVDEVRGALSTLRWGTLARAKPGRNLIELGKSIGTIWLGERRRAVEKAFGPGTPRGRGVVSYLGGRVVVDYEFHDRLYPWVSYLETRWGGYRTSSGVHVGSSREDLRRLFVTCARTSECYLLAGPWPDALATSFTMRKGKVAEIAIGYS